MGSIADRLAALLAEMEESDRRLAALADDARELINRTDAMLAEERPV
jgi:ABC-type transporter Mla subunit MlaD